MSDMIRNGPYDLGRRLQKCKRIAEAIESGLSIYGASSQFGVSVKSYNDWIIKYVKCACNMYFDTVESLEAHRKVYRHQ